MGQTKMVADDPGATQQVQPERVAVIAVHGVGDPGPSTTARRLAKLLSNVDRRDGTPPPYGLFEESRVQLSIRGIDLPPVVSPPTSRFDNRGGYVRSRQQGQPDPIPEHRVSPDVGFSYDQVCGLQDGDPDDSYQTIVLSGVRTGPGTAGTRVDIHELYWADLVRVGQGVRRTLGAIYQILLHLPSVGQHELDMAWIAAPPELSPLWRPIHVVYDAAVTLLCLPIPILNLAILGLVLVALPLRLPENLCSPMAYAILTAAAFGFVWLLQATGSANSGRESRGRAGSKWLLWMASAIVMADGGWFLVQRALGGVVGVDSWTVIALGWYALATAALAALLRHYDRLRPGAAVVGAVAGCLIVVPAVFLTAAAASAGPPPIVAFAFLIATWVWAALRICWILVWGLGTLAATLMVIATCVALRRERHRVCRAIATALVTLSAPALLFLLLTLTLWAILDVIADGAPLVPQHYVVPETAVYRYFVKSPARRSSSASDAIGSSATSSAISMIAIRDYARDLVGGADITIFAFSLGIVGLAVICASAGLLPSVVSDISPPPRPYQYAPFYCRWIDAAYAVCLPAAGFLLVIGFLMMVPVFFVARRWDFNPGERAFWTFGGTVAAGVAAIAATGRLDAVARTVGPVLTAILDIDAYLRVHPRDSNPKARIFARFVALLRSISLATDKSGKPLYGKVVIVAHSQGTVITVDLLRFLRAFPQSGLERLALGRTPPQTSKADLPLHFLSAGSPLRQLYAWRFPYLYSWADRRDRGPSATAAGLKTWVNVYRTGDYVGRSLWSVPAGGVRRQLCLGGGAHVHYFNRYAPAAALEIDKLI